MVHPAGALWTPEPWLSVRLLDGESTVGRLLPEIRASAAPYIHGEACESHRGQVHGEVTKGGSVHASVLLRKPLESVGVEVQSPGGSSRQGQTQEPSSTLAGGGGVGAELLQGSSVTHERGIL